MREKDIGCYGKPDCLESVGLPSFIYQYSITKIKEDKKVNSTRFQNCLYRLLILPLIVGLVSVLPSTADDAFANASISCKAGPSNWKWTVNLQSGDVLKKGDVFILDLGVPVAEKNLNTPSKWKVKSIKDNNVQWEYTGGSLDIRKGGSIAEFQYKDAGAVDGKANWKATFPKNTNGTTCGPVSLTSPRKGSLVAPSANKGAVSAVVSPKSGSLQSADGTVTISLPADSTSQTEELIYMPQPDTEVNNFTVVRSFTLDTYEEDDSQKALSLNQPVTVQATYSDVEINSSSEEELKLYYFDPSISEWVPVESTVDAAANKVVAELSDPDSFNKTYALMAPASVQAPAPPESAAAPETSTALEASAPPTEVSETPTPGSGVNLFALGGVALIALVGWLGLRKYRQQKAQANENW
jgi:hypothetical protein